ncbi:MAG: hypothetical protein ACTSUX_09820 [Promethearchaeota archaeon]
MHDDEDDFYKDFMEMFRKFFDINADVFDADFVFVPDPESDLNKSIKDKDIKSFKISYHYETGMDKPEIRFEGDIDENKLYKYFDFLDKKGFSIFRTPRSRRGKVIDASELSIKLDSADKNKYILEPRVEVDDFGDHFEIVLEVPGIESGHLLLSLGDDSKKLKISGENLTRRYEKVIKLPSKVTLDGYQLDVRNGIASIIIKKKNKG